MGNAVVLDTKALKNGRSRNLRLGSEDKPTVRLCRKLALRPDLTLVVLGHPAKRRVGGDRARNLQASSVTPPPPLAQEGWEWMGKLGLMCRITHFIRPLKVLTRERSLGPHLCPSLALPHLCAPQAPRRAPRVESCSRFPAP